MIWKLNIMIEDHINTLIYYTLLKEGFTGDRNTMTLQWLQTEPGATSDNLPDAWQEFYVGQGIFTPESRQDKQYAWLALEGFGGHESVNDRLYAYWYARSIAP